MTESPLTPCGALMCRTPFGSSNGGHTLAHAPVHVALPAGSTENRYSVSPDFVARTVPTFGTCSVMIASDFPEDPTAEAGGENDSVLANSAPALRAAATSVHPATRAALGVPSRPVRRVRSVRPVRPVGAVRPVPAAMSTSFRRVAGNTVEVLRKIGRGVSCGGSTYEQENRGGCVMTTRSSAPAVSAQPRSPLRTGRDGFELRGINHLALVCRDMARTVDFYSNVLGMPLVKTIELPAGMGQHFFFDCGGGDSLAFFWFPDAPDGVPGISAPAGRPDQGDLTSAVGSMNHVAFDVAPEKIEEYRARLVAAGVDCTEVANHDDSEWGISDELHPGVFVRSVYFMDPDGILLEFASWTRPLGPNDVHHEPATATATAATATTTAAAGPR